MPYLEKSIQAVVFPGLIIPKSRKVKLGRKNPGGATSQIKKDEKEP